MKWQPADTINIWHIIRDQYRLNKSSKVRGLRRIAYMQNLVHMTEHYRHMSCRAIVLIKLRLGLYNSAGVDASFN